VSKLRLLAVALAAFAAGAAGCTESTVFIPLEPSEQSARLTQALDDLYARFPIPQEALNSGRRGRTSGFVVYEGEPATNGIFVVDWSPSSSNVTLSLHRIGSAGVLDAPLVNDNCSLPPFIFNGGTPVGQPLPLPLCPTVANDTSNARPKYIEIANIPPGQYEFVITNQGPGNVTIRTGFFE
jgi:hypothetical protein